MKKVRDYKTEILIPAYQPSEVLVNLVEKLSQQNFEVVVVNDGSSENHARIFEKISSKAHILRHEKNQGKGVALKTGYEFIRRNFEKFVIITVDADGQHSLNDICKMAEIYHEYAVKLMLGVRKFEREDIPFRSKFGNILTRKILFWATRQNLSDTQTGLRAFDQSLVDEMLEIRGERYEYELNVLLYAIEKQIEIVETPIETIYEDSNSSSHFNPLRDSLKIYKEILKFASSSIISFVVDFAFFFAILVAFTQSWDVATSVTFAGIFARIISATLNFNLNKHFVFKSGGKTAQKRRELRWTGWRDYARKSRRVEYFDERAGIWRNFCQNYHRNFLFCAKLFSSEKIDFCP